MDKIPLPKKPDDIENNLGKVAFKLFRSDLDGKKWYDAVFTRYVLAVRIGGNKAISSNFTSTGEYLSYMEGAASVFRAIEASIEAYLESQKEENKNE